MNFMNMSNSNFDPNGFSYGHESAFLPQFVCNSSSLFNSNGKRQMLCQDNANPILNQNNKRTKTEFPKDPKALLHEIRPDIILQEVPNTKFTFCCQIDGKFYEATSSSKKGAKTLLAEKILVEHLDQNQKLKLEKPITIVKKYNSEDLHNKNPTALLNELCSGEHLCYEIKPDPNSKIPLFEASVNYKDEQFKAKGSSKTKAKSLLSKIILKKIYNIDMGIEDELPIENKNTMNVQTISSFNSNTPIIARSSVEYTLGTKPFSAILNEITQYETKFISSTHDRVADFTAIIEFGGKEFNGHGFNKKIAKNEAAKIALKSLYINYQIPKFEIDTDNNQSFESSNDTNAQLNGMNKEICELSMKKETETPQPTPVSNQFFRKIPLEFADILALTVLNKYKEILEMSKLNKVLFENSNMIVGVVMLKQTAGNMPNLTLIAASNASRCFDAPAISKLLNDQNNNLGNGGGKDCLTDCHAEVLCRKALQRFLWSKLPLKSATELKSEDDDIFEAVVEEPENDGGKQYPKFRLKKNVKFILYSSGFPCGSEIRTSYQSANRLFARNYRRSGPIKGSLGDNNGGLINTQPSGTSEKVIPPPDPRTILKQSNSKAVTITPQSLYTICPGLFKAKLSDKLLVKSYYSNYHDNYKITSPDVSAVNVDHSVDSDGTESNNLKIDAEVNSCKLNNQTVDAESSAVDKTLAVCNIMKNEDLELLTAQIEEKVGIMSCSDKLMLWNVIGIQGKCMTRLVEPIYLTGIITSTPYPLEYLYRAVYGRSLHFLRPDMFKSADIYENPPILQKTSFRFVPQNSRRKAFNTVKGAPNLDIKESVEEWENLKNDLLLLPSLEKDKKTFNSNEKESVNVQTNPSITPSLPEIDENVLKQIAKIRPIKTVKNMREYKKNRRLPNNLLPNFLKNNRHGFLWLRETGGNPKTGQNSDAPGGDGTLEILDANNGQCITPEILDTLEPLANSIIQAKSDLTDLFENLKTNRVNLNNLKNVVKTLNSLEMKEKNEGSSAEKVLGSTDFEGDHIMPIKSNEIPTTTASSVVKPNGDEGLNDFVHVSSEDVAVSALNQKIIAMEAKVADAQATVNANFDQVRALYKELLICLDNLNLKPSKLAPNLISQEIMLHDNLLGGISRIPSTTKVPATIEALYDQTKESFKFYCGNAIRIGTWMDLPLPQYP